MKILKIYYTIATFIFVAFMLFQMTSAEVQTLGIFKQHTCINLLQTCDNCSYVNITNIATPLAIDTVTKSMTKVGQVYNYTFCGTSELGKYIYTTCGDLNSAMTCGSVDFTISTVGGQSNYTLPIIIIILAFIILTLAFVFRNEYMGFASGALFLVEGVYIMIYGFGELNNLYSQAVSYISLALGAIFMIAAGYAVADRSNLWSSGENEED